MRSRVTATLGRDEKSSCFFFFFIYISWFCHSDPKRGGVPNSNKIPNPAVWVLGCKHAPGGGNTHDSYFLPRMRTCFLFLERYCSLHFVFSPSRERNDQTLQHGWIDETLLCEALFPYIQLRRPSPLWMTPRQDRCSTEDQPRFSSLLCASEKAKSLPHIRRTIDFRNCVCLFQRASCPPNRKNTCITLWSRDTHPGCVPVSRCPSSRAIIHIQPSERWRDTAPNPGNLRGLDWINS